MTTDRTLSEAHAQQFEDRGINAETAVRQGVFTGRATYREDDQGERIFDGVVPDPTGNIIVFPFFENGVIVNEKYRAPGKRFMQKVGGKRTFWNADALDDPSLRDTEDREARNPLVITEGEPDALTAIDCGFIAVSVPDGATLPPKQHPRPEEPVDDSSGKFEFLWNNRDRLKKIKRFIIAMDNDAAGQHMAGELVRRLSASRCQFVTYPGGCKDLNEVRMKHGPEAVMKCLQGAQFYPVRGVFELDQYPETRPIKTYSTGWETVDQHFKLFFPALTVISGIPTRGKSTWLNHLLINIARLHGFRTAIFSPEMPVVPFLRDKMRRCASGLDLADLEKSGRLGNIDHWIADRFKFIDHDFDDSDDDITLGWLLDRAAEAVLRHGIRILVIDPWNELEHARRREETMSEYVGRALRMVKKFARKYDLHIFIVAHPTKEVGKDGKSRLPSLYDVEHSAAWFNKPDVGIIVDRKDMDSDETEIHFQKVRFEGTGKRGHVVMAFDERTSRFMLLNAEERARRVKISDYR